MNKYFSENGEVRGCVKSGVSTDILIKTASNEINSLTKKRCSHSVGRIKGCWKQQFQGWLKEYFSPCEK
jgi:hypothetical protein